MIAVPVMERSPITMFIFVGALMSLMFGVLSLVLAVMVELCGEQRQNDIAERALQIQENEDRQKADLSSIFASLDTDGSQSLTVDELIAGAHRVKEFRNWLRVLDIDTDDLYQLTSLIDSDGSGIVDQKEFIDALYRLRSTDIRTVTRMTKELVSKMSEDLLQVKDKIVGPLHLSQSNTGLQQLMEANRDIKSRIDHMSKMLEGLSTTPGVTLGNRNVVQEQKQDAEPRSLTAGTLSSPASSSKLDDTGHTPSKTKQDSQTSSEAPNTRQRLVEAFSKVKKEAGKGVIGKKARE